MLKNKFSVYFIFISIFTVTTIFILIVQKSYSNLVGPSEQINTSKLLNKINPNLDTGIIKEIQNRPESLDSDAINFIIDTSSVTPIPTVTNQPDQTSESLEVSETNEE